MAIGKKELREAYIIAIDPGDKGTGIAYCWEHVVPKYKQFSDKTIWLLNDKVNYHKKILESINIETFRKPDLVIIEDFKLQSGRAAAQTNKTMATSELIGKIEQKCDEWGIQHTRQQNVVKARWSDKTMRLELEELGSPNYRFNSRHAKDAMRHLLQGYFFTYKKVRK